MAANTFSKKSCQ